MQSSSDDEAFREAEDRVEQGLYRDYVEAGEAFRQIRDEQQEQWRPTYDTWARYVEERHGICRQTAAYMIRAAEVAVGLSSRDDTLRLPVRHANLLGRFRDPEVRFELAKKIRPLTFSEAMHVVIDFSNELLNTTTAGLSKPGRGERCESLAQLDAIVRGCASLDKASLGRAASRLGDERRRRLARKAAAAGRSLTQLSEALTRKPSGDPDDRSSEASSKPSNSAASQHERRRPS
jgi:hypothetical protein